MPSSGKKGRGVQSERWKDGKEWELNQQGGEAKGEQVANERNGLGEEKPKPEYE